VPDIGKMPGEEGGPSESAEEPKAPAVLEEDDFIIIGGLSCLSENKGT